MAVPVDASVLAGDSYVTAFFGNFSIVCLPGYQYYVAFYNLADTGNLSVDLFFSNDLITVSKVNDDDRRVNSDSLFYQHLFFTGPDFPTHFDFLDVPVQVKTNGISVQYSPEYVLASYGVEGDGYNFIIAFDTVVFPGVLTVFSGVGSWLSGAVKSISTMFWTAESGMTVLGYLAVASLAVAVILLIFYLIAGWLKFH